MPCSHCWHNWLWDFDREVPHLKQLCCECADIRIIEGRLATILVGHGPHTPLSDLFIVEAIIEDREE